MKTSRPKQVAQWFSVSLPRATRPPLTPIPEGLTLRAGAIVWLRGPSGSGKSCLLRALAERARAQGHSWLNIATLKLAELRVVELFPQRSLESALMLLGRVGLGEVWTYLRKPSQLSDGQRFRLRLALALDRIERLQTFSVLAADEFGAVLDRVTAMVVARALRRAITGTQACAVVATSHEDLGKALQPNQQLHCDFGATLMIPSPKKAHGSSVGSAPPNPSQNL